jgi:hypothetical protein
MKQKYKKVKKFHVFQCWIFFPLRADVLYGGLGISKLIKKIYIYITLILEPDLDPDPSKL